MWKSRNGDWFSTLRNETSNRIIYTIIILEKLAEIYGICKWLIAHCKKKTFEICGYFIKTEPTTEELFLLWLAAYFITFIYMIRVYMASFEIFMRCYQTNYMLLFSFVSSFFCLFVSFDC